MSNTELIVCCIGNALFGVLIHVRGYRQGRRHEREMIRIRGERAGQRSARGDE